MASLHRRFDTLFEEMRVLDSSLVFSSFFLIRRIVLSAIIIWLPMVPAIQILLFSSFSFANLLYVARESPFNSILSNRMEMFNEFSVYLLSINFLCFSDLSPPEFKEYLGYSFLYLCLFQIGVNMLMIVICTL